MTQEAWRYAIFFLVFIIPLTVHCIQTYRHQKKAQKLHNEYLSELQMNHFLCLFLAENSGEIGDYVHLPLKNTHSPQKRIKTYCVQFISRYISTWLKHFKIINSSAGINMLYHNKYSNFSTVAWKQPHIANYMDKFSGVVLFTCMHTGLPVEHNAICFLIQFELLFWSASRKHICTNIHPCTMVFIVRPKNMLRG